jgi:hypothetical protein
MNNTRQTLGEVFYVHRKEEFCLFVRRTNLNFSYYFTFFVSTFTVFVSVL